MKRLFLLGSGSSQPSKSIHCGNRDLAESAMFILRVETSAEVSLAILPHQKLHPCFTA
jgi:hypothetical protein